MARAYSEIDRHHEAVHLIEKFNTEFDKHNANTLLALAGIYFKAKQYDKVIETCNEGLEVALKKNDLELHAEILLQLGDVFTETGNLEGALENYEKSSSLYQFLQTKKLRKELVQDSPLHKEFENKLTKVNSDLADL